MKYVGNAPGKHLYASCGHCACVLCLNTERRRWGLPLFVVGEPRQAEVDNALTVEELKKMGYVGFYLPEERQLTQISV